jgi:hypothetical protein
MAMLGAPRSRITTESVRDSPGKYQCESQVFIPTASLLTPAGPGYLALMRMSRLFR